MPPNGHALLGASSSHRWLNCPPSARLGENYADKGSDFAAEGTDAHALCEYKLRKALGMAAADPTENLSYYNAEMEECAEGYAAYILELVAEARESCADPIILIEQHIDYSSHVKDGLGTADCIIAYNGVVHVVDYKHGKGVSVSAEENPQMMLYALGALEMLGCIYDVEAIRMTIYQPRLSNISTYAMSREALEVWTRDVLVPTADLAYAGDGNYRCGEWCQFCKAKSECRARAEANMELARYDFKSPPLLTDEEIEDVLSKVDELVSWANDVKDHALQQALSGKEWNGYKLVEGRSNRKYTDERMVADAVQRAGYDPYEKRLLSVTAMTAMLGKQQFSEILGAYVEKPQGKPALVPESDKRPAISTAKNDFMEEL